MKNESKHRGLKRTEDKPVPKLSKAARDHLKSISLGRRLSEHEQVLALIQMLEQRIDTLEKQVSDIHRREGHMGL